MPWHNNGAISGWKQSLQTGIKTPQKSKKIDFKSHARKCWTLPLEQKQGGSWESVLLTSTIILIQHSAHAIPLSSTNRVQNIPE